MDFKIDTKEKMHVIAVEEANLPANMSDDLTNTCFSFLNGDIKNVILKLDRVIAIEKEIAQSLAAIQGKFAEENASFVICCLQKDVLSYLKSEEILEQLNVTPTESEAWDIVQMEEIEREFLDLS